MLVAFMYFVKCKGQKLLRIKRQNCRVNFISGYVASFWVKRRRLTPALVREHAALLLLVQCVM